MRQRGVPDVAPFDTERCVRPYHGCCGVVGESSFCCDPGSRLCVESSFWRNPGSGLRVGNQASAPIREREFGLWVGNRAYGTFTLIVSTVM